MGFSLLATGLGGLAGLGQAAKADVEVYKVSGIQVDATADTATSAREAALAQGHREAYQRLMARLVLEEDRAYVPNLGQRDINSPSASNPTRCATCSAPRACASPRPAASRCWCCRSS
jgi:hypothetical protein